MTEEKIGKVSREEIAEELFSAMKDVFVGKLALLGNEISLELLSGEKFTVSVYNN